MYGGAFAGVYDRLMEDVDYPAWAKHYAGLFQRAGVSVSRVLDCACGTGGMTFALHGLGFKMIGADRSVEMLGAASEKARSMGIAIPFIRQDLRRLAVHKPMDAVVCACDGVNYLLNDEDVRQFAAAAYVALRPGGGLFFDISSAYKLEHVLGGRCFGEDFEDMAYLWRNLFNHKTRRLTMELTFFTREADGRYAAARETHVQRAHEADALLGLLEGCGFVNVQAFGGIGFDSPKHDAERIHIMALRAD
ncbi:methyltransferase [Clostridia bacterium]|nr:methyltransferase [Clostridia bacterium]